MTSVLDYYLQALRVKMLEIHGIVFDEIILPLRQRWLRSRQVKSARSALSK